MAIVPKAGFTLEPHQVVIRPVLTEKTNHLAEHKNVYSFEVHGEATKPQIREAVELLWNVKVRGVRTMRRVGKPRRTKNGEVYTANWKIAVVKLDAENRINLY